MTAPCFLWRLVPRFLRERIGRQNGNKAGGLNIMLKRDADAFQESLLYLWSLKAEFESQFLVIML